MDTRAKSNTIRPTMAAMGRNNIAKNLGLAKFLIDRTAETLTDTVGLIAAVGTRYAVRRVALRFSQNRQEGKS